MFQRRSMRVSHGTGEGRYSTGYVQVGEETSGRLGKRVWSSCMYECKAEWLEKQGMEVEHTCKRREPGKEAIIGYKPAKNGLGGGFIQGICYLPCWFTHWLCLWETRSEVQQSHDCGVLQPKCASCLPIPKFCSHDCRHAATAGTLRTGLKTPCSVPSWFQTVIQWMVITWGILVFFWNFFLSNLFMLGKERMGQGKENFFYRNCFVSALFLQSEEIQEISKEYYNLFA